MSALAFGVGFVLACWVWISTPDGPYSHAWAQSKAARIALEAVDRTLLASAETLTQGVHVSRTVCNGWHAFMTVVAHKLLVWRAWLHRTAQFRFVAAVPGDGSHIHAPPDL